MSDCGGIYKSLDQTNPFFGVSGTGGGGFNLNLEPSLAMRKSLVGSNDNRPARENSIAFYYVANSAYKTVPTNVVTAI